MKKPPYFLVVRIRKRPSRVDIVSRHKSYDLAMKECSLEHEVVASFTKPQIGEFIQPKYVYKSTMKLKFGFTNKWLQRIGASDKTVRNSHYARNPASLYWLERVWAVLCKISEGKLTESERNRVSLIMDKIYDNYYLDNEEFLEKFQEEKTTQITANLVWFLVKELTSLGGSEDLVARYKLSPKDPEVHVLLFREAKRHNVLPDYIALPNSFEKFVRRGYDVTSYDGLFMSMGYGRFWTTPFLRGSFKDLVGVSLSKMYGINSKRELISKVKEMKSRLESE